MWTWLWIHSDACNKIWWSFDYCGTMWSGQLVPKFPEVRTFWDILRTLWIPVSAVLNDIIHVMTPAACHTFGMWQLLSSTTTSVANNTVYRFSSCNKIVENNLKFCVFINTVVGWGASEAVDICQLHCYIKTALHVVGCVRTPVFWMWDHVTCNQFPTFWRNTWPLSSRVCRSKKYSRGRPLAEI
jgi:hypothetical protein